jgi:hypothetical protein
MSEKEKLVNHGIKEEIKHMKSIAKEKNHIIMFYVWTENMMFFDYTDIEIIEKNNQENIKLIRDDDDILSSTFIPFNKIQAVKIEIHKTDSVSLLRKMFSSSLDFKTQTEQTPPLSNESKQSYT